MRDDFDEHLSQSVEIGTLCAYYGKLLTDHQQKALRLHYEEDLSTVEIAEMLNVSRQNVHDMMLRSIQKLYAYETALGFSAHERLLQAKLRAALEMLQRAADEVKDEKSRMALQQAGQAVMDALQETESTND